MAARPRRLPEVRFLAMAWVFLVAQALLAGVFVVRLLSGERPAGPYSTRAQAPRTAPRAWSLLLFHGLGVALVSLGISWTLISSRAHLASVPRTYVGLGAVIAALAVAVWALQVFTSWRLLAHVDVGHALCTEGPYRLVRHPIYAAMDLWAIGSALACPNVWTIAGAAIIFIGSDLRSRAEERLLVGVFGDEYQDYMERVRRLLPRIY